MRRPVVRQAFSIASLASLVMVLAVACSSPPAPAPVAVADTFVGTYDAALHVPAPGLLANDTPHGGTVDAGVRATTGGGSADVAADGGFTYQPATGFVGLDTFTYTVTNASGTSAAATVTIEVAGPPIAVSDTYASPRDTLLTVPAPGVLANDTVRGGTLAAGVRFTPAGGSAALLPDGSFQYRPAPGFAGIDSFSYTITNAVGTSPAATVTIEVPAAPWVALPNLPTPVSRAAGAVVDGVVYVIGGESSGGASLGQVFTFDRSEGSWAEGAAMPTPGSNLCAAAIGTLIYVPGGYTGTVAIADLRVYDTAADAWSVVDTDPLPAGMFASACAVHEGNLYVFGGATSESGGTTAWRYDPAAAPGERWDATLAPLPIALQWPAAVTVGDRIFVAGGNTTNSAAVFAYAPTSDTWTPYPDLIEGRGGPGAWVSGPYLYVGGGGWNSYRTSIERYDTRLGTAGYWTTVADLGVGRRTFAYASDLDAGWFYAVGGWNGALLATAEEGLLRALVP